MEETEKKLKICEISPKYQFQGPRKRELGDASGQEFREDYLLPWLNSLKENDPAIIDFSGTRVFSPSFLDECFAGAIREDRKNKVKLDRISFINIDPIWFEKLKKYIQEA